MIMTSSKSTKNGKKIADSKKTQRSVASKSSKSQSVISKEPKAAIVESTRTIKYHPLSNPESLEKWRKAIRTVLAREKASEYKTK
jgi:hypothetical protein